MKGVHSLGENLSILTIHCNLVITTCGKKMHKQDYFNYQSKVCGVNSPKSTTENLHVTIIFLFLFSCYELQWSSSIGWLKWASFILVIVQCNVNNYLPSVCNMTWLGFFKVKENEYNE
jgi:hypothetical protein